LPDFLSDGVITGVLDDLEPSGVFHPEVRSKDMHAEITCCDGNWQSAETNFALTEELLRMEEKNGWVEEWHGSWEDAIRRWGREKTAVSKLAVIIEAGKDPRLVVDATASGLNPRARIPERVEHPSIRDVMKALERHEVRRPGERLVALTLDVRAAHKRARVAESDGGLNFVKLGERLWRYKTCHFGGTWSAWWWSRIGSALLRLIHAVLGDTYHYAFLYVDDFLILVPENVAEECASLVQMMLQAVASGAH
jgi:hypothetical protein